MSSGNEISREIENLLVTLLDASLAAKGVPPIGSIGLTSSKIASSLLGRYFVKKQKRWFQSLHSVTKEEFSHFLAELDESLEEFWSNVLLTIARLDNEEKAAIGGNLLAALVKNQISIEDYKRAVAIVERTQYSDLRYFQLINVHMSETHEEEISLLRELGEKERQNALAANGLYNIDIVTEQNFLKNRTMGTNETRNVKKYELSDLGRLIARFGFGRS